MDCATHLLTATGTDCDGWGRGLAPGERSPAKPGGHKRDMSIQSATTHPSSSHGPSKLRRRWLKRTFPNFSSPSVAKYSRWHNVSSMYFESFESRSKITLSCKTGKHGDWHVPEQGFGPALPTRLRGREKARAGEGKPSSWLASVMSLESKPGTEASQRKRVGEDHRRQESRGAW